MSIQVVFPTCCLLVLAVHGCSSPVQIVTSPPTTSLPEDTTAAEGQARLALSVEVGATPLPEDVEALRMRVTMVHIKAADGDWITFPADANVFEIAAGRRTRKSILSTRVPTGTYDSLAVSLGDVFVRYDANAGGPLTLARDRPVHLPLAFEAVVNQRTSIRLVFEPGASLTRDRRHRWFFLPFFDALLE